MIGALALGFAGVEAGFVGFSGVWRGQICTVGDMVGDTVPRRSDCFVRSELRALRRPAGRASLSLSDAFGGCNGSRRVEWISELVAVAELDRRRRATRTDVLSPARP
jgi:hypothetical protein